MVNKKRITSGADIDERLAALQLENEILLSRMKDDVLNIKTYLPPTVLSEKFTLNSLSGIIDQVSKRGVSLGLVLPLILNNTIFRKKNKVVKALVTSLSLLVGSKLPLQDLPKAIKKIFARKKNKKVAPLTMENDIVVHS